MVCSPSVPEPPAAHQDVDEHDDDGHEGKDLNGDVNCQVVAFEHSVVLNFDRRVHDFGPRKFGGDRQHCCHAVLRREHDKVDVKRLGLRVDEGACVDHAPVSEQEGAQHRVQEVGIADLAIELERAEAELRDVVDSLATAADCALRPGQDVLAAQEGRHADRLLHFVVLPLDVLVGIRRVALRRGKRARLKKDRGRHEGAARLEVLLVDVDDRCHAILVGEVWSSAYLHAVHVVVVHALHLGEGQRLGDHHDGRDHHIVVYLEGPEESTFVVQALPHHAILREPRRLCDCRRLGARAPLSRVAARESVEGPTVVGALPDLNILKEVLEPPVARREEPHIPVCGSPLGEGEVVRGRGDGREHLEEGEEAARAWYLCVLPKGLHPE
mmetsp:Transcript_27081/g.66774  ORF Transcript_27081/g.66774 Transcript_27081/m.66774 type:complete len:384 (+) Transcript_27081:1826-2977(+)